MTTIVSREFQHSLDSAETLSADAVPGLVDSLLEEARHRRASDLHLLPTEDGLSLAWRIDGVLHPVGVLPRRLAGNVVSRLKVLAGLLTYRTDLPQEGRIHAGDESLEMRVSTFPTLYGEKAVVRLFVGSGSFRRLDDLRLPGDVVERFRRLLACHNGVILLTGPSGSGKTTTLYAALRELVDAPDARLNLVTLEDPIEAVVAGVAQSQVNPAAGFDYATGLRSLMRQDPDVIMVGEIRDRETAETVFQASLTGHLVLTSFHAGSAASAVTRLADMGVEPYQLRSGLLAIACQQLVRRLCDCAEPDPDPAARLGLDVASVRRPVGCESCDLSGFSGRLPLVELLDPEPASVAEAILSRLDAVRLDEVARAEGMTPRWRRAEAAVEAGWTTPAEIRRVLGFPKECR